jgi:nanoRNase/pAp phosphatase (c-di-AMP/oligoRNAs hydrolase)
VIPQIDRVKRLLTHKGCSDGIASALIVQNAFVNRPVEVVWLTPGTDRHRKIDVRENDLYCDLSPAAEIADLAREAGTIVLDHHETARNLVLSFGEKGRFASVKEMPGISGAMLAFLYVWTPLKMLIHQDGIGTMLRERTHLECDLEWRRIHELALMIGIRDTWQRDHFHWKEACAFHEALLHHGSDLLTKHVSLISGEYSRRMLEGASLLAEKERRLKEVMGSAYKIILYNVTITITPYYALASDLFDIADSDLVIGFEWIVQNNEPVMKVTLRSHVVDTSAISIQYGGGGHKNSSGFVLARSAVSADPFRAIEQILLKHLRSSS